MLRARESRTDSVSLIGAVGALVAAACCAGLPVLGSVLGGLTLAAVLGVAGAIVVVAVVSAAAMLVLRGRWRCERVARKRWRDDC